MTSLLAHIPADRGDCNGEDVITKLIRPSTYKQHRERSSSPSSTLSSLTLEADGFHMERRPGGHADQKASLDRFFIVRYKFLRVNFHLFRCVCHSVRDVFGLVSVLTQVTSPNVDNKPPSRISPNGWLATPPGSTVCLTSNGHLLHQQAHTSTSRLEALASSLLCWAFWLIGTQDNHQNENLIY